MTAPTSEERREVAARLHEFVNTDVWLSAMFAVLEKFGDTDRRSADVIADLIDPTCHLVDTTSTDGLHGPIIFSHELSCGHTCETFWREPPAYCNECGARVVSDDG